MLDANPDFAGEWDSKRPRPVGRLSRAPRFRQLGAQPVTKRFRVSADIGGTFTDLVYQDAETGRYGATKVLSTPEKPRPSPS